MTKNAIIFSGGKFERHTQYYNKYIKDEDYIITADSGTKYAVEIGIIPDIIVGDMDSIEEDLLNSMIEKNIDIIKFNPEKDYTDTEIAINHAMKISPEEIIIFGALGDRLDHTLAGIYLLKYCLDKGFKARIINEKNEITLIKDSIIITGKKGDIISLIPLTEKVEGITTDNLYYPLSNENLVLGSSRGVSNIMKCDKAGVKIKGGLLLVFKVHD
jgi:thiamine pyrophosphokinase